MKKQTILLDLSIALNKGYCGIAKENRLMYKMLAGLANTQLAGLLVSDNKHAVFTKYKQPTSQLESIEQANRFFHDLLQHQPLPKAKLLAKLKLAGLVALGQSRFDLFDIDPMLGEVVWRNVFDKSLSAEDKAVILANRYYFSNLTGFHLGVATYLKRNTYLDTTGQDVAIFLEPTAVKVAAGTKKIVRYHDAIALTEPDFSGSLSSVRNFNTLNLCAKDSYFVCTSEPTRQALLTMKPALEAVTFTIPCALSDNYKKLQDQHVLKQILKTRLSSQVVKPERIAHLQEQMDAMQDFNYIFNLATLDPKKNHVNLIRAWETLNYQHPGRLKLVIAANSGWMSEEAEEVMRPHIEMGNIIHIANLSVEEAAYVLSHARAFVFPSYVEGFGLPPLEAMQCECPTIVSDIKAHRWVMGDASLFCDPYDVTSIADAITRLTFAPDAESARQTLIQKGLAQVQRYSQATLSGQWADLLCSLDVAALHPGTKNV